MSTSIIGGCSRQAQIAAEMLPLYRRGAQALEIEHTIRRADLQRSICIQRMADDLGISYDHAEGVYDMAARRATGERE